MLDNLCHSQVGRTERTAWKFWRNPTTLCGKKKTVELSLHIRSVFDSQSACTGIHASLPLTIYSYMLADFYAVLDSHMG